MKIVNKIGAPADSLLTLKRKDDYVLLSDEEDITSGMLLENCKGWEFNYAEIKDCYQYLGKSFASQDDLTKDRIVQFCAISDSACVTHYVSKGLSEQEAIATHIKDRCNGIINLVYVCAGNIKDSKLIIILLSYMNQENAEKFLDATHQLVFNYANFAVYGKKYGNYIDGILDYIEDYGDFAGTGLSTSTLYPGKNLADLVSELVELITNGRSNIV